VFGDAQDLAQGRRLVRLGCAEPEVVQDAVDGEDIETDPSAWQHIALGSANAAILLRWRASPSGYQMLRS
jgi:hypothetical protein